jgi:glycosyltransferase involved in cell wall biosynthesis
MRRFGIRNVSVTPNGVDPCTFHPGARQSRFDLPQSYVLFVGALEPRKNLNALLQAWNGIKGEFQETWLIIVGVSGTVFKVIHLSQNVERVHFLGYVDDETLAGLYANATLFVLPSHEEGFGLPALEAMASGAPVIVSDGGALSEVVGEAGLSFCLANPTGLSDAMRQCLSNTNLRLALREKGLRQASKFSWQTTAELVWKNLNEI